MAEWLILLSWLALFPLLMGIVSYRGAAWCLERRNAAGCRAESELNGKGSDGNVFS